MPLEVLHKNPQSAIDLEALKEHLRLKVSVDDSYNLEDATLALLIEAAAEAWEERFKSTLITKTLQYSYRKFPAHRIIEMPRPPLQKVKKVEYLNEEKEWIEVDSENWFSVGPKKTNKPGRLVFASDWEYPKLNDEHPDPVRYTFKAGYGDGVADVPAQVQVYIMNIIGTLYFNRESTLTNFSGNITVHEMKEKMAYLMTGRSAARRFG